MRDRRIQIFALSKAFFSFSGDGKKCVKGLERRLLWLSGKWPYFLLLSTWEPISGNCGQDRTCPFPRFILFLLISAIFLKPHLPFIHLWQEFISREARWVMKIQNWRCDVLLKRARALVRKAVLERGSYHSKGSMEGSLRGLGDTEPSSEQDILWGARKAFSE